MRRGMSSLSLLKLPNPVEMFCREKKPSTEDRTSLCNSFGGNKKCFQCRSSPLKGLQINDEEALAEFSRWEVFSGHTRRQSKLFQF